jgi:hypothetical protein
MNAGAITAICTGVPGIIAAITALITALNSANKLNNHLATEHSNGNASEGLPASGQSQ